MGSAGLDGQIGLGNGVRTCCPLRIREANPHPCNEELTEDHFCYPGLHVEYERIPEFVRREPPGPHAKSRGHRWSAKPLH